MTLVLALTTAFSSGSGSSASTFCPAVAWPEITQLSRAQAQAQIQSQTWTLKLSGLMVDAAAALYRQQQRQRQRQAISTRMPQLNNLTRLGVSFWFEAAATPRRLNMEVGAHGALTYLLSISYRAAFEEKLLSHRRRIN